MNLKEQYMEHLKAQLDRWSVEIDRLDEQIRRIDPHLKIIYEERVAPLKEKRDEALRKLDELAAAPQDAWEELKCGVELTWDHLRDSMKKARAQLRSSHHRPILMGTPHKHVYSTHRAA